MKTNGNSISSKNSSDLLKILQDDYESKLSALKEKIMNSLFKKYSKIYFENNYTKYNLESDLNLILQNIDFNNFNYDYFVKEVEKAIIDKLNRKASFSEKTLEQLKNCVSPTIINKKIYLSKSSNHLKSNKSKEHTKLKKNNIYQMNSSSINKEIDVQNPKEVKKNTSNNDENDLIKVNLTRLNQSLKLKTLKHKADSEWFDLVKLDTIKAEEEKIKIQNKKKEVIIKMRENLQQQIDEANEKKRKNSTEEKMIEMKIELINKKKDLEIEKKQIENKMKVLKEKEIRDQFLTDTVEKKKKEKELEVKKDLVFLEQMKKEIIEEEEKKRIKKSLMKENMLKIIDENNRNIRFLKENQEKLRQEKKQHFEEYTNILEQQAIERDEKLKKMKDKIRESVEKVGDVTSLKNVILKNMIEDKIYEKDKVLIEKEINEENMKRSLKINRMKEDVLKINEKLLKEKHLKKEKDKELENLFINQVEQSLELSDKIANEKTKKDKQKHLKYQEELQKQINERMILNPYSMNDEEKKFNTGIIDEYRKHAKE